MAWVGWPGTGVLVPPVGNGVEKFDGSSDVKMVAVDGERVYLVERVERRAGVNPESETLAQDASVKHCRDSAHLLPDFHSQG